jgi:general secretion pathway protein N
MIKWSKIISLAALSSFIVMAGSAPRARSPGILPDVAAGATPERPEMGNLKSLARQSPEGRKEDHIGNPLWAIRLTDLSATFERPIFSTSRRPPRAAAAALVEQVMAPIAQKAPEPEHPALELIGAVVSDSDAIAVFFDRRSQGIVRLRAGDAYAGWVLSSVLRREVTLKKADQAEVLLLQRPDGPANSNVYPLPTPALGGPNTFYAPFVPRSTPKNGEPDGL